MKILLIDDSRATRYALRIELKRLGVEVETAESAEVALAVLKERIPDAILMDHIMPGLNGLEALEIIHADPRTAHVPIVLCTNQVDPEIEALARRKGVLDLLPKSSAAALLPDLIARIHALLEGGHGPSVGPAETLGSASTGGAPDVAGQLTEAQWWERVDARIEAALDRRLTSLIEGVRHDLTEMLIAETRHLVESRLAEERLVCGPEATIQALADLERRLMEERIPGLIAEQLAQVRSEYRAERLGEVVTSTRLSSRDPVREPSAESRPSPATAGLDRDWPGRLQSLATLVRDQARALIRKVRDVVERKVS
jgi:CheY-like chemotaxis protein